MNNKKILIALLLATITISWISYSFAEDKNISSNKIFKEFKKYWWEKWIIWLHAIWNNLTDAEKISLKTMSDEERKTFFKTKLKEEKAKRELKETVIDKLLAWKTLTTDEENVRAEIIKERAERKKEIEEMQIKMDKLNSILEKKRAGEVLIDEEKAILKDYKKHNKKGRWGMMWGGMWMYR